MVTRFRLSSQYGDRPGEMQAQYSLSARDTSDKVVSDNGVDRVGNAKDRHDDGTLMLGELFAGETLWKHAGGSSLSSETGRSVVALMQD
jgi:hypothetical protein